MKPDYVTPSQAAAIVGISRPAFLKHVKAKRIVPVIVTAGNRALFSRATVNRFKKERSKKNGKR